MSSAFPFSRASNSVVHVHSVKTGQNIQVKTPIGSDEVEACASSSETSTTAGTTTSANSSSSLNNNGAYDNFHMESLLQGINSQLNLSMDDGTYVPLEQRGSSNCSASRTSAGGAIIKRDSYIASSLLWGSSSSSSSPTWGIIGEVPTNNSSGESISGGLRSSSVASGLSQDLCQAPGTFSCDASSRGMSGPSVIAPPGTKGSFAPSSKVNAAWTPPQPHFGRRRANTEPGHQLHARARSASPHVHDDSGRVNCEAVRSHRTAVSNFSNGVLHHSFSQQDLRFFDDKAYAACSTSDTSSGAPSGFGDVGRKAYESNAGGVHLVTNTSIMNGGRLHFDGEHIVQHQQMSISQQHQSEDRYHSGSSLLSFNGVNLDTNHVAGDDGALSMYRNEALQFDQTYSFTGGDGHGGGCVIPSDDPGVVTKIESAKDKKKHGQYIPSARTSGRQVHPAPVTSIGPSGGFQCLQRQQEREAIMALQQEQNFMPHQPQCIGFNHHLEQYKEIANGYPTSLSSSEMALHYQQNQQNPELLFSQDRIRQQLSCEHGDLMLGQSEMEPTLQVVSHPLGKVIRSNATVANQASNIISYNQSLQYPDRGVVVPNMGDIVQPTNRGVLFSQQPGLDCDAMVAVARNEHMLRPHHRFGSEDIGVAASASEFVGMSNSGSCRSEQSVSKMGGVADAKLVDGVKCFVSSSQAPSTLACSSIQQQQPNPSLSQLVGNIRRLSRDQIGCRMLQQSLVEEGPPAATAILHELLPNLGDLMMDPFGNYLFQKLLDVLSEEERILLVKSVSTKLIPAALNLHGTRSVQKIVDVASASANRDGDLSKAGEDGDERFKLASMVSAALQPAAARLCIDSHGNHVIQRILLGFPPRYSEFVFECVARNVSEVARHRHGCCVIQRCIDAGLRGDEIDCNMLAHERRVQEESDGEDRNDDRNDDNEDEGNPMAKARTLLITKICECALELMQDAYGNYVVQYVLDVCVDTPNYDTQIVNLICRVTLHKVAKLSIQKFSSNVVEKCLEKCSEQMREMLLKEIMHPKTIATIMQDPFGNYVVQRALSVATHAQAVRLVEGMKPHLGVMSVRNTAGGRRIMEKICKRFPNFSLDGPGFSSGSSTGVPLKATGGQRRNGVADVETKESNSLKDSGNKVSVGKVKRRTVHGC